MGQLKSSIKPQRHREYEQEQRRIFWRKLTVRCILADVKHGKPVDPELVEWAKAGRIVPQPVRWTDRCAMIEAEFVAMGA